MKILKTVLPLLLSSFPAMAEPFTYAPATCDFQVTFSEKPFIEKKCSGSDNKTCEEVVTYTQMADAASLNFRITCIQEDPKILASYETTNLTKTLDKMVADSGLESFASDTATLDSNIKTAVALATGRRNDRGILYTGQIWLGKNSIFSLEGEMSGPQNKKVDEAYSQILKSVIAKKP